MRLYRKKEFIFYKTFKIERYRKFISVFMLFFVLCSASIYFTIAEKTHAATCGGAVVCACGDTVTSDYTLPANLSCSSGNGLIVGASGITIDGAGHKITGTFFLSTNYGIYNTSYNYVTVKNLTDISGFAIVSGIYFNGAGTDHAVIQNNTLNSKITLTGASNTVTGNNSSKGVNLSGDSNTVTGNTISGSGIVLSGGSNTVTGNIVNANSQGISTTGSNNNISSNNISSNTLSGVFYGISISASTGNTISNNTVNSNSSSGNSAYGIYLSGSSGNTISGNTTNSNKTAGIYLSSSTGNNLTGNTASSNLGKGISLETSSTSNVLTGNIMNNNTSYGLDMDDTSNSSTSDATNLVNGKAAIILSNQSNQTYDGNTMGGIAMFWCITCNNVTVKNATLETNARRGVYLKSTTNSTVQNITMNVSKVATNTAGIHLDSTSSSNTITGNNISNTSDSRSGISGIRLDGGGSSTISNNTVNSCGSYGISMWSSGSGNIIIGNTANSNRESGISVSGASNSVITGNTVNLNRNDGGQGGISISGITASTISDNTIFGNGVYGLYLSGSTGNTISGNKLTYNKTSYYDSNSASNTYTSNQGIYGSSGGMITFTDTTRAKNVGDTVSFSMSMKDVKGNACSACTYSVTTSPTETVSTSKSTNNVTGSFVVSRQGTYSLIFEVTDTNNNYSKKSYYFFAGTTASKTTRYYMRSYLSSFLPTHGQMGWSDSGALSLTAPTGQEDIYCSDWTQVSPDDIPNYPLANLVSTNASFWYTHSMASGGYYGIQKLHTYDMAVDSSAALAQSSPSYTWASNKGISNINWAMDNYYNWYRFAFKIRGTNVDFRTTSATPSFVDMTYSYTTALPVKSIGDKDISVLSATTPSGDTNSAILGLENRGPSTKSTLITLDNFIHPFYNATSVISSTSGNVVTTPSIVSGGTTSLTSESIAVLPPSGSVQVTAGSSSVDLNYHNSVLSGMNITGINKETTINDNGSNSFVIAPSAASVDVSFDTWNKTGNYYKKWIESSLTHDVSTTHTVGNLRSGQYYQLKIDGVLSQTLQANGSGEISFTYSGGYSAKTFEVQEVPLAPTISTPSANSIDSIRWNFVDNADNESGFKLYSNSGSLLSTVATPDISYIDEVGLSENTQYARYVKAYNVNGDSEASATTERYTVADTPSGLEATTSVKSAILTVDPLPNDTSGLSGYYFYRVGYEASHNSGWIQTNMWTDKGFDISGGTYAWAVKYRNGDGIETVAIQVSGTLLAPTVATVQKPTLFNTTIAIAAQDQSLQEEENVSKDNSVGKNKKESAKDRKGAQKEKNPARKLVEDILRIGGIILIPSMVLFIKFYPHLR